MRTNLNGRFAGRSFSDFNPSALLSLGFRSMEIRTALSPAVTIDLTQAGGSGGGLMNMLKPAVILDGGTLGRIELAPYGVPPPIPIGMLVIGGMVVLGTLMLGSAVFGNKKCPA